LVDDLEASLERLLTVLHRFQVPIAHLLQPGLAGETIERLASTVPFPMPLQAQALYRWRNGARAADATSQLFPGGMFLPLASAVTAYHDFRKASRDAPRGDAAEAQQIYDMGWFPLFIETSGDPHVVVMGDLPGAGEVWYVMIQDPTGRRLVGHNIDAETRNPAEDLPKLAAEHRAAEKPEIDVTKLVNSLASKEPRVRAHALQTLKRFLFPESVAPLTMLLSNSDPIVRADAASLLGQAGDRKAIPALMATENDPDPSVRLMVSSALTELRKSRT
jgi:HEAT repeats